MNKKALLFFSAFLRFPVLVKLLPVLLILFFVSPALHGQNKTTAKPNKAVNASVTAKNNFRYIITPNKQNGFGYDVYEGSRMLIHQPNVPGLPGNKGFVTKSDAEKTAKLVIKKLSNNIMPPTVSRQELEKLKIKI